MDAQLAARLLESQRRDSSRSHRRDSNSAPRRRPSDLRGLTIDPPFGAHVHSAEEFLDRAKPEVVIELTTLNPSTGEPAISHIRAAFERGHHVVTANKGPIAHAYATLADEARRAGVEFRFESDGDGRRAGVQPGPQQSPPGC